jgi:hypothetical protein
VRENPGEDARGEDTVAGPVAKCRSTMTLPQSTTPADAIMDSRSHLDLVPIDGTAPWHGPSRPV